VLRKIFLKEYVCKFSEVFKKSLENMFGIFKNFLERFSKDMLIQVSKSYNKIFENICFEIYKKIFEEWA
jgi:hypothetical protein